MTDTQPPTPRRSDYEEEAAAIIDRVRREVSEAFEQNIRVDAIQINLRTKEILTAGVAFYQHHSDQHMSIIGFPVEIMPGGPEFSLVTDAPMRIRQWDD